MRIQFKKSTSFPYDQNSLHTHWRTQEFCSGVGGGSTNSVEMKAERKGIWGR